jgi:hypothetical protein
MQDIQVHKSRNQMQVYHSESVNVKSLDVFYFPI